MTRSAEIFQHLETVARSTGDQIFISLLPGAQQLFGAAFGVWLLWILIDNGLIKKNFSFQMLIKPLITASVVSVFLSGAYHYKTWFYEPLYQTSHALVQAVIAKTTLSQSGNTTILGSLIGIETEVEKIVLLTKAISSDSAFYRWDHTFMGFFLRICTDFLWILYLSFAVELIFGLMIVTALAPLIMVCLAFEKTRQMGILACKIPIHGALTLVISSLALSFFFTIIQSSIAHLPMNESGTTEGAAQWTYTTGYDVLIISVLLAGLFLMKSAQYVSSFLQINISSGANTAVAAAGAMSLTASKNTTFSALGGAVKLIKKLRGKDKK